MVVENPPGPAVPASLKTAHFILDIRESDIAEMEYRFNSSMCNCPCDNAVALALRRYVRPDLKMSVKLSEDGAYAIIGGAAYAIGGSLADWLHRAYSGHQVPSLKESIKLPASVLRQDVEYGRSSRAMEISPGTPQLQSTVRATIFPCHLRAETLA